MTNESYIGFIYMWTNTINGKRYIGLHVGKDTDGYIGSGTAFRHAVKKYGIEAFKRQILWYEYENEHMLYQKEFELINAHNAVMSTQYYNSTNYDPKFASFVNGTRTRMLSEETREKIRQSRLGKRASDDTRRKMSQARSGGTTALKGRKGHTAGVANGMFGKKWYTNGTQDICCIPDTQPEGFTLGRSRGVRYGADNPFYGKHHTQQTKLLLREKNTGKLLGDNNPAKRPEVKEKIRNYWATKRSKDAV